MITHLNINVDKTKTPSISSSDRMIKIKVVLEYLIAKRNKFLHAW